MIDLSTDEIEYEECERNHDQIKFENKIKDRKKEIKQVPAGEDLDGLGKNE